MNETPDKWAEASWAAASLARHAGIACGARKSASHSKFHEEMAEDDLRRVAFALGFCLTRIAAPAVTEAA